LTWHRHDAVTLALLLLPLYPAFPSQPHTVSHFHKTETTSCLLPIAEPLPDKERNKEVLGRSRRFSAIIHSAASLWPPHAFSVLATVYSAKVRPSLEDILLLCYVKTMGEYTLCISIVRSLFSLHFSYHDTVCLLLLVHSTDCTYSHFERSSECPGCRAVLSESDFTELVVADSTSSTSETTKTSLQALFTKRTSSSSLPFSDLCYSLIRQIDAHKISTKFLLKQFLMDANSNGRITGQAARQCEAFKQENTQLKQMNSTLRLESQKHITDLQNKLQAREAAIVELQARNRSLEKGNHGGNVVPRSSSGSAPPSRLVMSRSGSSMDQSRMTHNVPRPEPPIKGFMAQKEAKERAQQEALQAQRAPNVLGRAAQNQSGKRSRNYGTESMPSSRGGHQTNITPIQQMGSRPFSSNSAGSIPGTPRIRDLTSSSGYRFTSGSAGQWQASQHINKRRRGTPSSSGGGMPSVHRGMSPSTAFTLNNGHHSRRGPNQYFTQG